MELVYLGIIAIVIAILAIKFLGKRKTPSRTTIFIVGEIGAGKTSLLYFVILINPLCLKLANRNNNFKTINSIEPN